MTVHAFGLKSTGRNQCLCTARPKAGVQVRSATHGFAKQRKISDWICIGRHCRRLQKSCSAAVEETTESEAMNESAEEPYKGYTLEPRTQQQCVSPELATGIHPHAEQKCAKGCTPPPRTRLEALNTKDTDFGMQSMRLTPNSLAYYKEFQSQFCDFDTHLWYIF